MTVVNIRHFGSEYDVYIGRGSKWGNPFSHKSGTLAKHVVKTRKEAIECYREWVLTQPTLLQDILDGELDGKRLGCFCKPYDCHGDVLLELTRNKELVRLSLEKLKQKIAEQKAGRKSSLLTGEGIEPARKFTPVKVERPAAPPQTAAPPQPAQTATAVPPRPQMPARVVPTPPRPPAPQMTQQAPKQPVNTAPVHAAPVARPHAPAVPHLPKMTQAQREAAVGAPANFDMENPHGYVAFGKHDVDKLNWLKEQILQHKIMAFDYETDGDPDDETTDPQDHVLVGVSCTFRTGFAVYLPIAHDNYGANWDKQWLVDNFLKPLLEHPDVYIIAHNIKAEYQWSLLVGIDFFHKAQLRKCMDTMLMVKSVALPETVHLFDGSWEVVVGLKPTVKTILADENGMVHGLIHVDDIKSFKETVGRIEWEEPIPGEFYKSGEKKGQPKTKKMSRSRTFNELPVDKHTIDYAASDSDWALGVFQYYLPICEAAGVMDTLYELDVMRMMVLAEYELAGWHISRDKLLALGDVAQKALYGDPDADTEEAQLGLERLLQLELMALVPDAKRVTDPETGWETIEVPAGKYPMGRGRVSGSRDKQDVFLEIKSPKPFNWGSTQHKQWLFYHILKFPTDGVDRSKSTGLPTTDGETIDRFIKEYEGDSRFMELLKERAKYHKMYSTYVEGLLPFCRVDTDRIHTNLKLVSTWRLSSSKPNLQNIPRPDNDPMGIRSVFVAPHLPPTGELHVPEKRILLPDKTPSTSEPMIVTPDKLNPWTAKTWHFIIGNRLSGHVFYISADYSQIELKVLAWFANERTMIETLANGGDLHSKVAKDVFKLDCEVEQVKERYKPFRYRAKKVNFGLVYGMTEYGLSSDPKMGMTVEQAKQFIEDYMRTYPGVREYANEQIAFARKNGYVTTMFGHRRPVPHINDPNKWVRQKAENICMNTPIQGSAADIMALAMVNLRKEQDRCPALSMHMQIHDELQGQAPVEHAVEAAVFMKEVMERPIDGFSDIMPITADAAVGATWDTALDLQFEPDGTPFVKPKKEKKEATDVTYDMIAPYEHLYKLAGIKIA